MKPTVKAAESFDAKHDAEELHKALKGLGTDEETVIRIIARRSNLQRQQIASIYKQLYGKDLIEKLKCELKGKLEAVTVAAVTPVIEFLAREIHEAMEGLGTKEDVIAEILGTADNSTIHKINEAYKKLFDTTLEKDIKKDTTGCLERLFVLLSIGNRDESTTVDNAAAHADAIKLFNDGEGRMGTDEETFTSVLALRSRPHLREVFSHYKKIAGHSFAEAVEREFTGEAENAMLTVVHAVCDPTKFMAYRLHDAMKGLGTKDRQLIRVIVWRSEIDLGDIKEEFDKKFEKPLADVIEHEASGDYKHMLQALID